jgi:hypothetical protein
LAVDARIGHYHFMASPAQRSLEHRLPRRLFRQVQLVGGAAADGQNTDAGRIDSGTPKAHGIAPVHEFSAARIETSSRYGGLDVAGDGQPALWVPDRPLSKQRLGGESQGEEHEQIDADQTHLLRHFRQGSPLARTLRFRADTTAGNHRSRR